MKKILILLMLIFMVTGCSKTIEFEKVEKSDDGFHEIISVEKINGGVIYYNGNKVIFEKDGYKVEIADDVQSLWRENDDIYYDSNNVLYSYNIKTNEEKRLVDRPYNILGKYNDNIISYYGRSIYSINGTKKTRIFKDGYYLNRAVLYNNKVYGIPSSNIYEYNLDTLKVNKMTKGLEMSFFDNIDNKLYVITKDKKKFTYYKITDNGLERDFVIKGANSVSQKEAKDGMFIETNTDFDDHANGNKLLYVHNGKIKNIDNDYSYYMLGIIDNKFCYYKNKYNYGTYDDNLKTFYLYDGHKSTEAFELDVDSFEDVVGHEFNDGLLIEVIYESLTKLYKYDGKDIIEMESPNNFFRVIGLEILDNKAYIRYSDGEESMNSLGTIIDLSKEKENE